MQIITDLNTFFRKDKTYWINNLLQTMSKFSNWGSKSFNFARSYQVWWLSENNQRKVLKLLTDYKFLDRVMFFWDIILDEKTWKTCRKKIYNYSVTTKFYNILRLFIVKKVNRAKWIELRANNTITEVKQLIKKIYTNTKFTRNSYWSLMFEFYWKQLAILQSKQWVIIWMNWYTLPWLDFYSLYIKD